MEFTGKVTAKREELAVLDGEVVRLWRIEIQPPQDQLHAGVMMTPFMLCTLSAGEAARFTVGCEVTIRLDTAEAPRPRLALVGGRRAN